MGRPRKSAKETASSEAVFESTPAESTQPFSFAVTRSIKDMVGEDLKAYARKVGVSERDVIGLSESRLRQNCMVMAHENLENV
jgi:hypothetical protein